MSRPHPFDYAFAPVADTWFPEIRDEAAAAAQDATDLAKFLRLQSVQRMLGELAGEPGENGDGFLPLLYSAFRFWQNGKRTIAVSRAALEAAMDVDRAAHRLPDVACYVQLPEHWIWGQVQAGAPHEPLDGMFIAPGERELIVTGVLGIRPGRDGYSQITAAATARGYEEAVRAAMLPRFAPAMEGGAAAGFRSVRSNYELLLLASLALTVAKE